MPCCDHPWSNSWHPSYSNSKLMLGVELLLTKDQPTWDTSYGNSNGVSVNVAWWLTFNTVIWSRRLVTRKFSTVSHIQTIAPADCSISFPIDATHEESQKPLGTTCNVSTLERHVSRKCLGNAQSGNYIVNGSTSDNSLQVTRRTSSRDFSVVAFLLSQDQWWKLSTA